MGKARKPAESGRGAAPVALFVTQLEPGGAQSAAIKLAEGLSKRGMEAKLYFLYEKKPVEGVPFDYAIVSARKPRDPLFLPDLLLKLVLLFHRTKPSGVVSFTHYANIVLQPIAALMGVKTRIASQRSIFGSYPLIAKVMDVFLGTIGIYTRNVMVSQAVLRSFGNCPKPYLRRTCVIPNGFAPPSRDGRHIDLGSIAGLSNPSGKVMIAIGRLVHLKNHSILIRILPKVPDLHLLIVGDGPLKGILAEQAEREGVAGRIRFLHALPNRDIVALIGKCSLFALPSLHEGMSNVLIEALFSGTPIIASDIETNREVLVSEEGAAGMLADPGDAQAWAEKVGRLLGDKSLADGLVRNAERRSRDFGLEKMIGEFEKILP